MTPSSLTPGSATADVEDRVRAMLTERAERIDLAVLPSRPLPTAAPPRELSRVVAAAAAGAVVVAGIAVAAHVRQGAATTAPGPTAAVVTPFPSGGSVPPSQSPAQPTSSSTRAPVLTQADAVRQYFQTDPAWVSQFGPHEGALYCGLDILGASKDGRYLYLFVDCEGLTSSNGIVSLSTATQTPVRATVTGSGAQTRVVAVKRPLDGSPFRSTLRALFSTAAYNRVVNGQYVTLPTDAQLQQQFDRDICRGPGTSCSTIGGTASASAG
jgi:hypothetical protein